MSMGTLQDLLLSDAATERFFKNISLPTSPDGCWEWTGTKVSQGYGHHFCGVITRKTARAHRLSYEIWKGLIPEGLTIDHLCYNKACVNPLHLEAVTRGENARRAHQKVTHCPKDHEYTPSNTKKTKRTNGERSCLRCHREREQAKRASLRIEKAGTQNLS